jgi:Holliday junction DNA helicase RuvA
MFRYLTGKVMHHSYESVTIDILGIGFYVFIPPSFQERLSPLGETQTLHVAFVVREFSQSLYGFFHEQERDLFEQLLAVSGVGPKLALNIVGHLPAHDLAEALIRKDIQKLCQVPGIGKKTAERLFVELKGISIPVATQKTSHAAPPWLTDATLALVNLGYSQLQAQKAITKTLEDMPDAPHDLSFLITASLRHL